MFLIFFRNIFRPQHMFPQMFLGLRGKEAKKIITRRGNIKSNNVSAAMYPRLRGPLDNELLLTNHGARISLIVTY